jgi:hypothetical protein
MGDSKPQDESQTLKDHDSVQGSDIKRLTVTSDYESSDSPSDHSDNITGTEESISKCKEVPGSEIKPAEATKPQVTFKVRLDMSTDQELNVAMISVYSRGQLGNTLLLMSLMGIAMDIVWPKCY